MGRGPAVHVITTADGPVTPVGIEQRSSRVAASRGPPWSASGPPAPSSWSSWSRPTRPHAAGRRRARTSLARPRSGAVAAVAVAAVLVVPALPTDIRHNSKIDRTRVAAWAERVLAGGRMRRPVRVLVTGASGLLGRRGRAAAAPAAATTCDRAPAAAVAGSTAGRDVAR